MTHEGLAGLIQSTELNLRDMGSIAIMPDYFVDRFVRIDSIEGLVEAIMKKSSESGGGSIRGVKQTETKGGNAVNTAYALGKFGANVNLLAIADSLPAMALLSAFKQFPNVAVEIARGPAGYTIAFEFVKQGKHVNVMVSEAGGIADFDGSEIPRKYWQAISNSKIVCVLNWGSDSHGTELCETVFKFSKERDLLTFMDPADPAELSHKLPELKKKVFDAGLLDVLSLNENEARIFSKGLSNYDLPQYYDDNDLERAIKSLSEMTGGTVDLHTRTVGLSCRSGECTKVKCYNVLQKTITGAGDVWDAAELIGYLSLWRSTERLQFANAAAGLYVSRESAEPPSISEILEFVRKDVPTY